MAQGILRSNKTRDGIAGALAYQIGDLEEDQYQIRQEWTAQHAQFNDMQDALEQAGLRVLTKPNLIKQNWWTSGTGVDHLVVYGRAARIFGSTCPYLTSNSLPTETTQTTEPTAAQKAAATSIYSTTEGGVTTYHIFTDNDDFQATVATLAAADQITETDGTVLDKAIQYEITANSAYGNTEWLLYHAPYSTRVYDQGTAVVRNYGQIEEMEPGETYSMSCWVRVLSGDGAWMRMGYGNSYTNQPSSDDVNHRTGRSDWIEVLPLNGVWQRISWTFEFNPTGDWYSETSAVVDGVTKITRTYNWFKKVGFGVARKYDATLQICGFRLVRGKTYTCETYDDLHDDLTDARERVEALETEVPATKSALLAIAAENESLTANSNHAVGDLFVVGDVLYKSLWVIAAGESIIPGTNCVPTTLADQIAIAATKPETDLSGYAPLASPHFSGSIALGGSNVSATGSNAIAAGGSTVSASGDNAAAFGYGTAANGKSMFVCGINNADPTPYPDWETDTWYYTGTKVTNPATGKCYVCNYNHTSSGSTMNVNQSTVEWGERIYYWREIQATCKEAFAIGNGRTWRFSETKSNAFAVDWDGNVEATGQIKGDSLQLGNTTLTEYQLQRLKNLLS